MGKDFKNGIDRRASGLQEAEIVLAVGKGMMGANLRPETPLVYDKGFNASGATGNGEPAGARYDGAARKVWRTPGAAAAQAAQYGFPPAIYGYPLGCGCSEAYLHGIGERTGDTIEMDYMCDYGYHNFVVFRIGALDRDAGIKLDKTLSQHYEEAENQQLTLGSDDEPPRKLQEY